MVEGAEVVDRGGIVVGGGVDSVVVAVGQSEEQKPHLP